MRDMGSSEVESRVHEVAYYLWGSVDPAKFTLGVNPLDYVSLGGDEGTTEMQMSIASKTFKVVPVAGLAVGQIALIWV